MTETKLNQHNPQHQLLIALMANFVTEYGYTTRELFQLMDHSQGQLWSALTELEENNND